jgi:hypothetical protein
MPESQKPDEVAGEKVDGAEQPKPPERSSKTMQELERLQFDALLRAEERG